jgi:hypothetical protein
MKKFLLNEAFGQVQGDDVVFPEEFVLNGRYLFKNGEMLVASDDDAEKMKTALCEHFGCEMEDVVQAAKSNTPKGPSLAASQTK